jgi:type I restriction enzyme M protein
MARSNRIGFISMGSKVCERLYNFEWFMGLSLAQRQRSIRSLHDEIKKSGVEKVLEISSKSEEELGRRLSAFNLMVEVNGVKTCVESIYHSSKVFYGGIKYNECVGMNPKECKKFISDEVENKKLLLKEFEFNGMKFDLNTKSLCYDYIYILGLTQNEDLAKEIVNYDCFTDIVFSQTKGIGCQARTCALYKYLRNNNLVEKFIKNPYKFGFMYKNMYRYN